MVADGGYDEAIRNASANLDNDADISFFDKHFVLSGFDDVEETIITKIEMRGGYVHDKMVKKADYLVICMETPGSAKLKQALLWRESGSPCLIVSNHQLDQAFERIPPVDPETLRQRDEERIIQAREKKNDTRKTAMERKQQHEDARRQRFEEKQRQVEEARMLREETRRQKYEAKQNEAGKHRRQLSMKSEDEPVDNAGNASVIAQSEIKKSSPSDAKPQQPTALDQPELAEKAPEDRAYYGDHTLSRVIIPEGCESIG